MQYNLPGTSTLGLFFWHVSKLQVWGFLELQPNTLPPPPTPLGALSGKTGHSPDNHADPLTATT